MTDRADTTLPPNPLTAISPLDGRYHQQTSPLSLYASEYGLIRFRIAVEARYLIALAEEGVIRKLTKDEIAYLSTLSDTITLPDAAQIKKIEEQTKHDIKAIELFLREKCKATSLSDLSEMIHFGITSEDINNIALRMMLRESTSIIVYPQLCKLLTTLKDLVKNEKGTVMLARTHGQPAVPTTLGKELAVFYHRLDSELTLLSSHVLSAKLSGAVGNMNALSFVLPDTDWQQFSKQFIASFGFTPSPATVQTNPYEDIIAYFQILQRCNNILLNVSQDMWRYISDGWYVQEVKKDEVGSSTMPQKVNPIFFENAEGNIGLANALIDHFTRKLSVTRLQRDLSDSTITRNFGVVLGYSSIAYMNLLNGLERIQPDREKMKQAVNDDWSILSEAAQTLLRFEGIPNAYMLVKKLARGKHISKNDWEEWVTSLPLSEKNKSLLAALTPEQYIGNAEKIAEHIFSQDKKKK